MDQAIDQSSLCIQPEGNPVGLQVYEYKCDKHKYVACILNRM